MYIEGNICDIIYLGVVNRLKQNDYNSWCGLFWLYYLCQLFSSLMYLYQKTKERPHNSFLWLDFPNRLSCQMVYYFCHVISKYRIFLPNVSNIWFSLKDKAYNIFLIQKHGEVTICYVTKTSIQLIRLHTTVGFVSAYQPQQKIRHKTWSVIRIIFIPSSGNDFIFATCVVGVSTRNLLRLYSSIYVRNSIM